VITGALSSGLTGHTITHSDIGGYTAEIDFENSQLNYIRSPELLKRWSELEAFGFGLFRTHIGSSTNSVVAQVIDDGRVCFFLI
jgi:alpha-glucosidase